MIDEDELRAEPVYRDAEGKPVCSAMGNTCKLMAWSNYGKVAYCYVTGTEILSDAKGQSLPTPNCPLWKGES